MALVLHERVPDIDYARLVRIRTSTKLGEAIGGDVPAPEQAGAEDKAQTERCAERADAAAP